MYDKHNQQEGESSDTFEIIDTDCSAGEVELSGLESSSEQNGRRGHSSALSQRSDNHSGFSLGLGCTFSSLFSGFAEPPNQTVKKGSSVWFLGVPYFREDVGIPLWKKKKLKKSSKLAADPFRYDFYSRLWFTYRRNFPMLGSQFTSDCGWGCMLRTGQMMLGQALVSIHLGRDWRWNPDTHEPAIDRIHRRIVAAFGDTDDCPFSIHRLVRFGKKVGKRPGDWFGPSSVAYALRDSLDSARKKNDTLRNVRIYVASNTTIIPSEVEKLFVSEGTANSVVVLVPVRLGVEKLNELYVPAVKQLLTMECAIGIIGGRPKHSLYFAGWQDEYLIYFDPHSCQSAVDVGSPDFPLESFHCNIPRRMSFRRLDPTMCFGFCFHDVNLFHRFKKAVDMILTPSTNRHLPMFTLSEEPEIPPPATHELTIDSVTSCMSDLSTFSYEFI